MWAGGRRGYSPSTLLLVLSWLLGEGSSSLGPSADFTVSWSINFFALPASVADRVPPGSEAFYLSESGSVII